MNDHSRLPADTASESQKRFADALKLSPEQEKVINGKGIRKPSFWDKPLLSYAPTIGPNNIPAHRLREEADGSVVLYPSRVFLVLALLCSLVFSGCGVLMLLDPAYKANIIGALKLGICVFYSMVLGVLYAVRLFSKEPILKLDRNGITVAVTVLAEGFIPWGDIVRWKVIKLRSHKILAITLRPKAAYLTKASLYRRFWIGIHTMFDKAHIHILQGMLTAPAEVVLLHMDRLAEESRHPVNH